MLPYVESSVELINWTRYQLTNNIAELNKSIKYPFMADISSSDLYTCGHNIKI